MTYKTCTICGKKFPITTVIDGKTVVLKNRKHCLNCVPYKSGIRIEDKKEKKQNQNECMKTCLYCGEKLKNKRNTFCCNECQQKFYRDQYIKKWKNGEVDGTTGNRWIDLSNYIRNYIFEKYDYKCARCGWGERNPYTGTLPLEIEHIDGNAKNNAEENLILLCPNCHSLTPTYRGANKGNGHRNIKWTSR